MAESTHPTPSDILNTAIVFAVAAHRGAFRKGTGIPYILHPLEAAAIAATITVDRRSAGGGARGDARMAGVSGAGGGDVGGVLSDREINAPQTVLN
jgi:hypothetical protein